MINRFMDEVVSKGAEALLRTLAKFVLPAAGLASVILPTAMACAIAWLTARES